MNQTIEIKNFLVIKKALLNIKRLNLIIGPQANGKSIIAKLVYFFQGVSGKFIDGIRSEISKRELDKSILSDFESKFPRYTWEGSSFTISYILGDIKIEIVGERKARNKTNIKLIYSKNLVTIFNGKKKLYKKNAQRT